ncbi:hypothetical protein THICB3320008 [Thiomonas sp. CB3]|nr:hypothetical protein THICB3320008 [Thiomonas sp. CB3]
MPLKDASHAAPGSHGLANLLELLLTQEPFGHGQKLAFFARDVPRMVIDEFIHRGSVERVGFAACHAPQLRAQRLPDGSEFTMVVGQRLGDIAQADGV